jgi:hypothetical protein
METYLKILGDFFNIILIVAIVSIILALPTMLLWNWLMPILFGLTKITFWQALGINIFTGILFKSSNTQTNNNNNNK